MNAVILLLLACGGTPPTPTTPPAPPRPTPAAPVAAPPTDQPETRWELDAPGGGGGAPLGADFYIGTEMVGASTYVGDVGGAFGFTLTLTRPSNAVACSQPFPVAPKMAGRGRIRLRDVQPGPGAYQGFTAEVRNYDTKGVLVPGPGSQYIPLQVWRERTDWVEFGVPFTPPEHADNAKICLRFVDATGEVDVDWLGVSGVALGPAVVEATEAR